MHLAPKVDVEHRWFGQTGHQLVKGADDVGRIRSAAKPVQEAAEPLHQPKTVAALGIAVGRPNPSQQIGRRGVEAARLSVEDRIDDTCEIVIDQTVHAGGGIDISHNTEANDAGFWQGHLYLVAEAADTPALRRAVRARCPGEPSAPRPFTFKEVRDLGEALSYAVKASIYRRSSYIDNSGRRNARPQALGAERAVEAALFQHRWPPGQRLLLRGLRLAVEDNRLRLRRLTRGPVVEGRQAETGDTSPDRSIAPVAAKLGSVEPVEQGGGV